MLHNTETSYGSVAKWLHWVIALWMLVAYLLMVYLNWIHGHDGPLRNEILLVHKAWGFTILLPVAARVVWRFTNVVPKLPDDMPMWQRKLSHISHFLLYFFLISMPVSGYLGNTGGVSYGAFHITPFQDTAVAGWIFETFNLTPDRWDDPFDAFHYRIAGPFIVWVLVLMHAGAAIYHHTVQKDDVLRRMLPERPGRTR